MQQLLCGQANTKVHVKFKTNPNRVVHIWWKRLFCKNITTADMIQLNKAFELKNVPCRLKCSVKY